MSSETVKEVGLEGVDKDDFLFCNELTEIPAGNQESDSELSGGGIQYRDPKSLEVHPYNSEVLPELSEEKYEALKRDIEKNGIRKPLDLSPDDKILDGKSKNGIAIELGIEKVPCIGHEDLDTENKQRVWIIDANYQGRNWDTKSEYKIIAEQSFNLEVGRGGDRRSEEFQRCQNETFENFDVLEKTAEKMGVSRTKVYRARKYHEAIHDVPNLDRIDEVIKIVEYYKKFEEIKETAFGDYPEWIGNLASHVRKGTDFVQLVKMARENPRSMNRFYKEMKRREKKIEQRKKHRRKKREREAKEKEVFGRFDFSSIKPVFAEGRGKASDRGVAGSGSDRELPVNQLLCGDSREVLKDFPESSVHFVQFSPWYYNQRAHGLDGEIGAEESVEEYIEDLVELCSEIKRVLRPDGSMWIVIGDTWIDKNQQEIPGQLGEALKKNGWILRNKIPWVKKILNQNDMTTVGSGMPGPVEDRFLNHHEFILFLTPNRDCCFDQRQALTKLKESTEKRCKSKTSKFGGNSEVDAKLTKGSESGYVDLDASGAKPGDVWRVKTAQRNEKHYSAYSKEICDIPIKVACPERVCSDCGAPYSVNYKLIDREPLGGQEDQSNHQAYKYYYNRDGYTPPDCGCGADYESGIVLDPTMGTGSTLVKAKELGRRYIGIDLDGEAVEMAERRLELPKAQSG